MKWPLWPGRASEEIHIIGSSIVWQAAPPSLQCRSWARSERTLEKLMLSTYSQVLRIIEKEKVQKKSKKRAKPKSRKKNCLDKKCRNKAEKKQTKVQKKANKKGKKKQTKKGKKNKQKKQKKCNFSPTFPPLFLWLWNLFPPTFSPLFLWLWKCQNFALSSKKSKKSAKKVQKTCKKRAKKVQKQVQKKCKKSAKKKRAQFASKKMLFFAFLFAFFCFFLLFFCSFFAFLERCYFVFAFHARTFSALFLHFFCFPYSHRSWLTGQHKEKPPAPWSIGGCLRMPG